MSDIIKVIKPIEDSHLLIDGIAERKKTCNQKNQEGRFLAALLAPLATSLVQPLVSLVLKTISRSGVRRAGRGYMN